MPEDYPKGITVSEAILCQTSTYFVKALAGEFGEAYTGTLRFPGWKVDVIKIFLFGAYKQVLPDFTDGLEQDEYETKKTLIRLWLFGDAHLIPRLQNAAMTTLVNDTDANYTHFEVIRFGFEEAPPNSALRRFVVDEATYGYFGTNSNSCLSEREVTLLLNIPSFQAEFLKPLRERLGAGDEVDSETYQCAHDKGLQNYMVKGD